jgi:hypothetical protein
MAVTSLLAIITSPLTSRLILSKITLTFLENILDTLNYRVLLLGNSDIPGFGWNYGLLPLNVTSTLN